MTLRCEFANVGHMPLTSKGVADRLGGTWTPALVRSAILLGIIPADIRYFPQPISGISRIGDRRAAG